MKKKKIKSIVIFFLVLTACYLVGFIAGMNLSGFDASSIDFDKIYDNLGNVLPFVYLALSIIAVTISVVSYVTVKIKADKWDGEDEDEIYDVERKMNIPNFTCGIYMVINLFFFSTCLYLKKYENLAVTCFAVTSICLFTVSGLIIRLEKKLNPEKRGSIFDLNFAKIWENSSDEAQKLNMYKAGYKTYKTVNVACMILWVLVFLEMMVLDRGFSAMICICIIWLTSAITYLYTGIKLEKQ